jgi:hypothetical protein
VRAANGATYQRVSAIAELMKNVANDELIPSSVLGFDSFSVSYFTFVHSQAETTIRVGARPRLKNY